MNRVTRRILATSAVSALALSAASVAAQSQPGDSPEDQAADAVVSGNAIVVTAQKREQTLQEVPLAVTAVTGEALQTRNITDTSSLTQVAPSLTYTQGNNPSNSSFRIRGIGTSVFGQGTETAVSTVIDGVVMARQAQGFTDLADIERVEVLRGPQGTLFGKNATAGVISVVTARPTNYLSGRISATAAEMDEYHLSGTVSAPIGDAIGFRVTGYYNNDDGYIYNYATDDEINGYESWGLRGKLEFDFGALYLLASASYNKNDADCCSSVPINTDNPQLAQLRAPVVAGPDNAEVNSDVNTTNETESKIYSLEASYDLGPASITSITAFQEYSFANNAGVDGLNNPQPIYSGGNGNAPFYAQFDVNGGPFDLNQISQELRIGSNGENRFNYVFGFFYSDLELDRSFVRRIVSCPTTVPANMGLALGAICPAPSAVSGTHEATLDNSHIAGFGQVDFNLFGGLTALAGLRVQREEIAVTGMQIAAPPFPGDLPMFTATAGNLTSGTADASDSAVTGKAGLQYEFSPDLQAYATYTRGYKGQSLGTEFNQTFNNNPVVLPEDVDAYEIGLKGSTVDGLLSFSLAAFQADYTNLQVQANRSDNATGNFLFVVTNAGRAQTKGIELEATLQPTDSLSIGGALTYLDAEFDADGLACPLALRVNTPIIPVGGTVPDNACVRVQSVNNAGQTVTSGPTQFVRGGVLPNTPEWRISLSPRYEREFGDYLGFVTAHFSYQSEVSFSLEQDADQVQEGYALVDASIGIRPLDSGLSASLFVKNLFDQRYYASIGNDTSLTSQTLFPGNLIAFRPKNSFRHFGVTVGYSF